VVLTVNGAHELTTTVVAADGGQSIG
jgi:hypothetical protein